MKRQKNIHIYHHFEPDPLFYKIRPYVLTMLLLVFISAITLTILALCDALP